MESGEKGKKKKRTFPDNNIYVHILAVAAAF